MNDHAIVNLPLHKRGAGSLDAQIDRDKRRAAAEFRAAHKTRVAKTRADREHAKLLFALHGQQVAQRIAFRVGASVSEVLRRMKRMAYWEPESAIRLLEASGA